MVHLILCQGWDTVAQTHSRPAFCITAQNLYEIVQDKLLGKTWLLQVQTQLNTNTLRNHVEAFLEILQVYSSLKQAQDAEKLTL